MEEKELQQPMSSGEVFLQVFEEGPISNNIPQGPRLGTIIMMKRKGKALVE
jgi:hypothetical protein